VDTCQAKKGGKSLLKTRDAARGLLDLERLEKEYLRIRVCCLAVHIERLAKTSPNIARVKAYLIL
jgi:hypothetical protein